MTPSPTFYDVRFSHNTHGTERQTTDDRQTTLCHRQDPAKNGTKNIDCVNKITLAISNEKAADIYKSSKSQKLHRTGYRSLLKICP